jgi:hypothetical protein
MLPAITQLIHQSAVAINWSPTLLQAQVQVESAGDTNAFRYEPAFFAHYVLHNASAKAALYGPIAACSFGLLQIMWEVAVEEGYTGRPECLFDPATGLMCGTRHLQKLRMWRPDDDHAVLAAYNGGMAGNGNAPYRNADYIKRVLAVQASLPPIQPA